jgi:CRP/FNR family cyclic AMP-dependent transcriptional regulator
VGTLYRVAMSLLDAGRVLPRLHARAGETVIRQGEPGGRLLVLIEGTVVVHRDEVAVARIDRPGAVFGEMAVALDRPATASVLCQSDAVFGVADDAQAFLVANPGAAMEIVRMLAARLDAVTQYLVDIKSQYADRGDHLAMLDTVLDALSHQQRSPARPGSARDPEG